MRRLVYAPYVQAYVKTDTGVVDISPYVVRGAVTRKVNEVSSAQLTIRNPLQEGTGNLLFTEFSANGEEPHPMFHPMDPIVILLQRLQGHPVQVFTGYLDKTPYIQFYPGLCSLEASCTLKRLLYTQWDSALPSTQTLLSKFGFTPTGSGIVNQTAEQVKLTPGSAKDVQAQFNDGSLGALLFEILNVVGDWDHSTIWIEALPPNVVSIVKDLYSKILPDVNQAATQIEAFMTKILGAAGQGGGNPGGLTTAANGSLTGPVTIKGEAPGPDREALITQVMDIATTLKAPKLAIETLLAACIQENNFRNTPTPSDPYGSNGLLQLTTSTSALTGIGQYDVPGQVSYFLTKGFTGRGGAIQVAQQHPDYTIGQIIDVMQNPGGGSNYNQWQGEADKIINAYHSQATNSGNSTSNASTASTAPTATATTAASTATATQASGTSPGGQKGTPPSSTALVFPLVAGTYNPEPWSLDQGVDISTVNAAAGTAAPLLAMASGTVTQNGITGFGPSCPVLKLDTPIGGYTAIYYGHAGPDFLATPGTKLTAGQKIASVGAGIVGISSGPHLEIGFCDEHGSPAGSSSAPLMLSTLKAAVAGQPAPGGGTTAAASGTTTAGGGVNALAAAFSTMINLPSILGQQEAYLFTGKRSFIADSPLFPFIEQLCKASLRNFMSMPNGNFFAFFPDYFGLFGRKYYWEIRDLEMIDARIDLSDDPLLTHVAVAGDVTQFHGTVDIWDKYLAAGIFDIYDAISTGYVGSREGLLKKGYELASGKQAAVAFLQKYGVRPHVEEVAAIRSPVYELFLAFQNFMIAWSGQFKTTFELTFMPELFPGGLVGLPDHHLQLYIDQVEHSFDYESGFTTNITVSSPSQLDSKSRSNLRQGMARPTALQQGTEQLNIGKINQLIRRGL